MSPIPITLITGFWGAGKTTLLNRILHAPHGLRIAVLVNDFGAVNIDSRLIVGVENDEVINLANGCICCTIREDLLTTVLELLQRPEQPEYIVIEASGVSDPVLIAQTFRLPALRTTMRLDSIMCVVDAETVRGQTPNIATMRQQIESADTIVLNKLDLVDEQQRDAVHAWLLMLVPRARILPAMYSDVPIDLLLGVGRYDLANPDPPNHQTHSDEWATWHYTSNQALDMTLLQRAFELLPAGIFRAKGIVYVVENPSRQAIVQLAGKRINLTFGEIWGNQTPYSEIVVIGKPEAVVPEQLQRHFEPCIALDDEPSDEVLTAAEWRKKYG